MRIAYFTAGTHGAGHLVRGLALHRALLRLPSSSPSSSSSSSSSLTFGLFAPAGPYTRIVQGGVHEAVDVDPDVLRDPARAPDSALARALFAFRPDVVVVDVFWVPLVFVPMPCPVWLLLRSVPKPWLIGPKEARFDVARYERVLAIEPAPGLEAFEAIDPVVVCDPDDVPAASPFAGRRVIVRAGLKSDGAVLDDAARALHPGPWTTLDLAAPTAPFPAAPLLVHADAVVAAPGYNTFWEARHLGFAARTTFVPIRRALDDAAWRASLPPSVTPTHNGAHTLARLLADRFSARPDGASSSMSSSSSSSAAPPPWPGPSSTRSAPKR